VSSWPACPVDRDAYHRGVTARRLAAIFGAGLAAAQAGHLVAFELRYGSASAQLQSMGVHAYFPVAVRTGLGLAAVTALAAAFIVAAARVVAGRRVEPGTAPPYWRLLSVLYTVQLACFAGQETLEALLGGAPASPAPLLLLWGAAGQLPIAVVVALTLRWLLARLGPALTELRVGVTPSYLRPGGALVLQAWPVATAPGVHRRPVTNDPLRGPPPF
jgi:hypothetical protein